MLQWLLLVVSHTRLSVVVHVILVQQTVPGWEEWCCYDSSLITFATLSLWTFTFSYYSPHWDSIRHCFYCHFGAPVLVLPQGVEAKTSTCNCFWKSGIWWTQRWRWKLCYDWFTQCEPLEYDCTHLHVHCTNRLEDSSHPLQCFSLKNVEHLFSLWFIALLFLQTQITTVSVPVSTISSQDTSALVPGGNLVSKQPSLPDRLPDSAHPTEDTETPDPLQKPLVIIIICSMYHCLLTLTLTGIVC